jgi:hypothetical protein
MALTTLLCATALACDTENHCYQKAASRLNSFFELALTQGGSIHALSFRSILTLSWGGNTVH